MPDHDDLFASFKTEGLPVRPMPASEVRRRGDRMRRRNNTVAAVGGVAAALVVIATPLAIVTSQSSDDPQRPPVATRPALEWRQEVPPSFDVSTGIQGRDTSQDPEPRDRAVLESVEVCGDPAFAAGDGTVDTTGALYAEPNTGSSSRRTLALYADGDAAAQAYTQLFEAIEDCPSSRNRNGDTVLSEARESTLVADDTFAFTQQVQFKGEDFPAGELMTHVVARTGNALLVTESASGAGGDEQLVAAEVRREQENVAAVVSDMAVFSEQAATDAEDTGAADLGETIPDDFDLLAGFPEQGAATDVGREGPSRDLDLAPYGTLVEACGSTADGLPEPTDTLDAGWREAAGGQLRRLMTFGSADDAQAYADAVMAVYSECPEEAVQDRVTRFHETSTTQGVGDHAATAVSRFEVDGEPGPGYQVVQVVRVGQALLLFVASYDGADPVDPGTGAADLAATYLGGNQAVVAAM